MLFKFNLYNLKVKGKYYNPDNQLLYDGDIINEIPLNNKDIKIYNDYTYIIYERNLKEVENKGISLEYIPNYYIKSNVTINNKDKIILSNILFLSLEKNNGETTIIHSLINKEYNKNSNSTTVFQNYNYEYHDNSYILRVFGNDGLEKNLGFNYIKKANIILIIFNLFDIKELIKDFIEKIHKKKEENSLIYLIGKKFKKNKVEDQQKIEDFRNYAKKLIEQKKIDKYFEIDAMTGEGIGDLDNSIKFDNTINENKKNTLLLKEKNEGKNKNNHNKKDCIIY